MNAVMVKNLIDKETVMCGTSALTYNGLSTYSSPHLSLMTQYEGLDGCNVIYLSYYYYPVIDKVNWVRRDKDNPLIFIPSRERAIIDYLRNDKWCDEGVAIEALKDYLDTFLDVKELYKVADYYEFPRNILDNWLEEARNEYDV